MQLRSEGRFLPAFISGVVSVRVHCFVFILDSRRHGVEHFEHMTYACVLCLGCAARHSLHVFFVLSLSNKSGGPAECNQMYDTNSRTKMHALFLGRIAAVFINVR